MERYDPQAIEAKWQQVWADEGAFEVPNPDLDALEAHQPKSYVVEMLPYPSGELHMGHTLNYTIGDVVTHLRRRRGMKVLRPMGYDAFGLPAENAAIREGGHPRVVTERNIASIRDQMQRMGWAIDWSREISTHEPAYYRWTQWLFLRFFERGLAYRKEAPVKWCPKDQTVLANEQVIDGRCERCGSEVEAKNLTQWFFRITQYADELLDEMELLLAGATLTMRGTGSDARGASVSSASAVGENAGLHDRPDTLFGAIPCWRPAPTRTPVRRGSARSRVHDYVRHAAARPRWSARKRTASSPAAGCVR
jgi:leucyl-tRNA synthetase